MDKRYLSELGLSWEEKANDNCATCTLVQGGMSCLGLGQGILENCPIDIHVSRVIIKEKIFITAYIDAEIEGNNPVHFEDETKAVIFLEKYAFSCD